MDPKPSKPSSPLKKRSGETPSTTFGKFERHELLGTGGMGEVWKAWDTELSRWIALKFLKSGDEMEIARFKREAQVAGKVGHPNIAAIYEVGEGQGRPYIAMQFVDGVTLKAFARQDRKLLARLIRDAALAIHAANQQRIIHRDIKPENLMVATHGREPHIYVMDFGLARATEGPSDLSQSGTIVGTPAYMSPEQSRGEKVDARTDVYSLGATFYEVLTNRRPFTGSSTFDILHKVQEEEPRSPRRIDPRIPADLETIVLKCMEKDRTARYASLGDLAEDLTRWLDGEPIEAHPPSVLYRWKKAIAKRRTLLLVGAAGIVLAGTVGLVLGSKLQGERVQREEESAKNRGERAEKQKASQELSALWSQVVSAKEWTREKTRRPAEIRDAFAGAIQSLTRYVERTPDPPQGWYLLARARLESGDIDGATDATRRALKNDAGFAPGWALLGRICLEKYQLESYGTSRGERQRREAASRLLLKEAQEALERGKGGGPADRWAIPRTPDDDVQDLILDAMKVYYVDARLEDATRRLIAANARAPSEAVCHWLSIFLLHDPDDAMKVCDQALYIAPHSAQAHFDRGSQFSLRKQYEPAVSEFDAALELNPRFQVAWFNRGLSKLDAHNPAAALADFEEAIRLNGGTNPNLVCYRGWALYAMGKLPEALAEFNRAIDIDPRNDESFYARGQARFSMRDPDGAYADFDHAIELAPENGLAFLFRGKVRELRKDPKGAMGDYDRAIGLLPTDAKAFLFRGKLKSSVADPSDAIRDLDQAILLDPKMTEAWRHRGIMKGFVHRHDEALQDLGKALELDPRSYETYFGIALTHIDRGNVEAAVAALDKALELAPQDWDFREQTIKMREEVRSRR